MSRKVKVNWSHFSGGTYLQLTEHADAKRIHSFKFGMEIAKRLKFTLLQKSKELLKYTPSYRTSRASGSHQCSEC